MGADGPSTGWTPLRVAGPGRTLRSAVARSDKAEAFFRLALTQGLVAAGDAMVTVSLAGSIFFTTNLNGARPRLVLSLLLTMAPFAVVAPLLGPAIDRSRGGRRLMIVASAGGRAVVCLYMATVVHTLLLYPCALAILILSKAHSVAKSALVPATVDSPAEFVKAGGRLAIVGSVAGLLGAIPAALVWKVLSVTWSIRLAALVYAGAAVMAVRIRPAPPAEMAAPDHVDEEVRSRGVSLAATCMITLRACSGFLTFAVAFIFRRSHAPAYWYGLVGTGALLGGFLGNVVGPKLRAVLAEERIITAVLALVAFAAVIAARLEDRPGLALLAFAIGLADGVGQLAFDAIVQRDGSEGSRGRSFARFEASFQLAWVGAALIPVVVRVPIWVAGVTMAAAAGASAVTYAVGRHITPQPAGTQPSGALPATATTRPATPVARPATGVGRPPPWDVALAFEGADPGPAPEPDVWTAIRPDPRAAVSDTTEWDDDSPTPPLGVPPVPRIPAVPAVPSVSSVQPPGPPPGGSGPAPAKPPAAPAPPPPRREGGPRRNPGRFGRRT